MSKLIIYPAQAEDFPDLLGVLNDGTRRKVSYGDMSWGSDPDDPRYKWVEQNITGGEGFLHYGSGFNIARLNGLAVGSISLRWQGEPYWEIVPEAEAGYIRHMVVKESHKGMGIGADMVDWTAEQTAEHGFDRLRLDCSIDNGRLCDYYVTLGFTMITDCVVPPSYEGGDEYHAALFERLVA